MKPTETVESTQAAPTAAATGTVPGLLVAALVAAAATWMDGTMRAAGLVALSAVFLAIVAGVAMRPLLHRRIPLAEGAGFAAKRALRAGIVLLGLRFSLGHVVEVGGGSLLAILAVITTAFGTVALLVRLVPVERRVGVLIGAGTAICGNSAVAAIAPLLDAREEEISFATATVTLFGTVAMLGYPLLGHGLGLSNQQFGLLAGVGVHDSAQAIASGFIFSAAAGAAATVVKLTRTAFLIPLLLVTSAVRLHDSRHDGGARVALRTVIPWFALGFLATSALRTLGDLALAGTAWWTSALDVAASLATFLVVVAMAGVGLGTDLVRLRRLGPGPFIVGFGAATAVGAVALLFALIT